MVGAGAARHSTAITTRLEMDHGVDFPALPFLYETLDQIQRTVKSRKTNWIGSPLQRSESFRWTFGRYYSQTKRST